MIINDKYKFIFVHIPKTSGTYLRNILLNVEGSRELEDQHSPAIQAYDWLTDDQWYEEYNTFTIVRDPIQREVSTWNYMVNTNDIDIGLDSWLRWRFTGKPIDILYRDGINVDRSVIDTLFHFGKRPQFMYMCGYHNQYPIVRNILRFEDLERCYNSDYMRWMLNGADIDIEYTEPNKWEYSGVWKDTLCDYFAKDYDMFHYKSPKDGISRITEFVYPSKDYAWGYGVDEGLSHGIK